MQKNPRQPETTPAPPVQVRERAPAPAAEVEAEASPARQKARGGNASAAASAQESGRKQQDEMLQWVQGRLSTVAEVQRREVEQTSHRNRRAWWDEVSDSHKQKKGITRPDPGQWCECARLYRDAARCSANGDAVQAARLMRQAVRAESAAWERLTRLVKADDLSRPTPFPWERTVSGAPAPSRQVPAAIEALASRIISSDVWVAESPVRIERRSAAPASEAAPPEQPKDEKAGQAAEAAAAREEPKAPEVPDQAPEVVEEKQLDAPAPASARRPSPRRARE